MTANRLYLYNTGGRVNFVTGVIMRVYFTIAVVTCLLLEAASFVALLADRMVGQTGIEAAATSLLKAHPWARQEVVFGAFDPIATQRYSPNSVTGVMKVNQHGFIGNGSANPALKTFPAKPEGMVRVFLLGGSSLAGNALRSDNTQTIAAFLERKLNLRAQDGSLFQVLNYGMSGAWTFAELRRFFAEIIHLEPDVVVNLDGWNDAVYMSFEANRINVKQAILNWDQLSYLYFEHFNGYGRGQTRAPPVFTYTYLLLDHFGLFEKRMDGNRAQLFDSHHMTAQSRFLAEKHNGLHFTLTRNLDAISAYSAANGIRHIAYLQPYADRKRQHVEKEQAALDAYHAVVAAQNGNSWLRDQYRSIMDNVYEKFEIAFDRYAKKYANQPLIAAIDLTNLFQDTESVIYLDSIHYNERGNEIIAERMTKDIFEILAQN